MPPLALARPGLIVPHLWPASQHYASMPYYRRVLAVRPGNLIAYWPLWDRAGGFAYEAALHQPTGAPVSVTPTLGGELLTNGDMETGDPPASWTAINATLDGVADERTGGSGEQSLSIINSGPFNGRATQPIVNDDGDWLQIVAWGRKVTNAAPGLRLYDAVDLPLSDPYTITTGITWAQGVFVTRLAAANATVGCRNVTVVAADEARYDSISAKVLTLSTCFGAKLIDAPAAKGNIRFTVPTLTASTQAGLAIKHADANNCVIVYHDRTNVRVIQYVGGAYSLLAGPVAATWSATTPCDVRWSGGTSLSVDYGGTVICAATPMNASLQSNQSVVPFSTYASNQVQLQPPSDGLYTGVTLGRDGIGDGGAAPQFDGIAGYTNIYSGALANLFNGSGGTAIVWARVANSGVWVDGTTRRLFTVGVDNSNRFIFARDATNGRFEWAYIAGGTQETVRIENQGDAAWHCYGLSWSKSREATWAYRDGLRMGTTSSLGVWAGSLSSNRCVIGAGDTALTAPWHGSIAHVQLYNTVLSPDEHALLGRLVVV